MKLKENTLIRIDLVKMLYVYLFYNNVKEESLKIEHNESCLEIFTNIVNNIDKYNDIINKNIKHYSINRLNLCDLAIIYICIYDLLSGLPKAIAINEAINLSKIYTYTINSNSVKFNNKLLDDIAKYLEGNK